MNNTELLGKKINALRLELPESIVNDISKTYRDLISELAEEKKKEAIEFGRKIFEGMYYRINENTLVSHIPADEGVYTFEELYLKFKEDEK